MLMEEGVGEAIMDTLKPVLQQNQFTLSMGNKLEVHVHMCVLSKYEGT